ncbi:MAG: sigma-70 family RNA polymerase sigma factor [Myxococcota bacterium]
MVWRLPIARRWMLERALAREWPRLRAFALQLTREPASADDLLQIAAERASRRIHQLKDPARFRVWMYQILRNCHIDELRRPPAACEAEVVALPSPESELRDRRLGERIAAALDDLPEPQRLAVWLVDGEGLTFREAADVLDLRPGTVASRVARGRATLRSDLEDLARERGVIA